ncbi:MAG: hypothetical protein FH754_17745 [Marinobacter sp.]|nr:hypothetical protein [Marinobacter sp.]
MNRANTIKNGLGWQLVKYHICQPELIFCSLFNFNLDHALYVDELYHLLPAQSILADNSPAVAEGEYIRAGLYTRFVASMQILFGESVEVMRASSAVTVSAFVTIAAMDSIPLLRSRAVSIVFFSDIQLPNPLRKSALYLSKIPCSQHLYRNLLIAVAVLGLIHFELQGDWTRTLWVCA